MDVGFSEESVHTKLWDHLTKIHSEDCLVKNWKGWTYRVGKKEREKTFFYREFDIARFHKEQHQYSAEIQLYGYEVKGYERIRTRGSEEGYSGEKHRPPAFGLGVDQVLVLLYQGADYAQLVIPEPRNERDRVDLKEFCDRFAPYVGVMLLSKDGYFWPFREPTKNPYATEERKKKMLTSLISGGQFSDIRMPLWCRRHEF